MSVRVDEAAREAALSAANCCMDIIGEIYHRDALAVSIVRILKAGPPYDRRPQQPIVVSEAYQHDVIEPNEKVYGKDVEAARNVLKRYRKGQWHINGQIVREALDAAYAALAAEKQP